MCCEQFPFYSGCINCLLLKARFTPSAYHCPDTHPNVSPTPPPLLQAFFSTLLVVLSNASILWLTFPYVRPKQFATRAFSDLSQHLLPHTSLLLSCHLFCFFLLYLFVVYYIVTQSWTVRGSKPGAHTMEARKHQVVILGAGISGDYQSLLRYLLIHTLVVGSIVSFTYPIILFDVDVCSFVYKILHYVNMAFSSCPV